MADKQDTVTDKASGNQADNLIDVKWRTCNCQEVLVNGKPFWLGNGIMRTLLENINPDWKKVPTEPQECTHWQHGNMKLMKGKDK